MHSLVVTKPSNKLKTRIDMKPLDIIRNGIITENPTFVLLLGMCPTLATTSSASNGLGDGSSDDVCTNLCEYSYLSYQKSRARYWCVFHVTLWLLQVFVTVVQMVMQAYMTSLYASLGLFIPLIVVNCIVLGRAEAVAAKNGVAHSALDGVGIGLGFTCSLTLLGMVRELLGTGKFFGMTIFPEHYGALLFVLAPGAFVVLGYLIAISNVIKKK